MAYRYVVELRILELGFNSITLYATDLEVPDGLSWNLLGTKFGGDGPLGLPPKIRLWSDHNYRPSSIDIPAAGSARPTPRRLVVVPTNYKSAANGQHLHVVPTPLKVAAQQASLQV